MLQSDELNQRILNNGITKEQLKQYIEMKDIRKKSFICEAWLKGYCIFSPSFCHHAHGSDDLIYSIDSVNHFQPYYDENITAQHAIFSQFNRTQFWVLYECQNDSFIKPYVQKYSQELSQIQQHFSLEYLATKSIIREYLHMMMILKDICNFLTKIINVLQLQLIPLELYLHELKRVGFLTNGVSFQNYNPLFKSLKVFNTEIYQMESSQFCFFIKLKNPYSDQNEKQFFIVQIKDYNYIQIQISEISLQCLVQYNGKEFDFMMICDLINEKIDEHNDQCISNPQKILPLFETFLFHVKQPVEIYLQKLAEQYNIISPSNLQYQKQSLKSGLSIATLNRYLSNRQPNIFQEYQKLQPIKNYICPYWERGFCIFRDEDCKLAHGLKDSKIDYNVIPNQKQVQHVIKFLRDDTGGLIRRKSYYVLYITQFEMINLNILDEIRSLFQINTQKTHRNKIRDYIKRKLIKEFFQYISNDKPLQKSFVENQFLNFGLGKNDVRYLIVKRICYEKDYFEDESYCYQNLQKNQSNQSKYFIPIKDPSEIEKYYLTIINTIILKHIEESLAKKIPYSKILPINQFQIRKCIRFYNNNLEFPEVFKYFYTSGQFTAFLKEKVIPQIIPIIKQEIEDPSFIEFVLLKQDIEIINFNQEVSEFDQDIISFLKSIENKSKCIFKFEKLINYIEKKNCKTQGQYQTNIKIKNQIKEQFLQIQAQFACYLISIGGLDQYIYYDSIKQNQIINDRKECICGEQYQIKQQDIRESVSLLQYFNEYILLIEKDIRNTIIIDSLQKLHQVEKLFQVVNMIGVDIECDSANYQLWLIQFGIKIDQEHRLVFIFDLIKIRDLDQDIDGFRRIINFLKEILENERIRKVFHDQRNDSFWLHKNNICPKNIWDTNLAQLVLVQVNMQKELEGKEKDQINQFLKNIGPIEQFSLNYLLKIWQAKHGPNEFKQQIHLKFENQDNSFFYLRPNILFHTYGARDVEDLVEIAEKQEIEIKKVVKNSSVIYEFSNKLKQLNLSKQLKKKN